MRTGIRAIAMVFILGAVAVSEPAAFGSLGVEPVPEPGTEPVPKSVPSFNESPGCEDLDGIRGPLAREPGLLPLSEPIYGPWGDFYGRTVGLAWDQRTAITLPNMVGTPKTLWVHSRLLPSFNLVLSNLAAANNVYTIRYENTWSWSSYTIPPGRHLSFHAVGAAIDINSDTNPHRADNVLITDMPAWFVDAWRSAGWCWGGDWQSIKDPMHYSWKGPLHTPGFTMPPAQPPLVAAAPFSAQYDLRVGLTTPAPTGATHHITDIDRDGAVDVIRVQPSGSGRVALVGALARDAHNVGNVQAVTVTAPFNASAPVALVDLTRDGRPDLVYLLNNGGTLRLEVFALVQSRELTSQMRTTSVPFDANQVVLFDDVNRDGDTDIVVISPGSPATLTVWHGPGFATATGPISLAVPFAGHRFAFGDRAVGGQFDVARDLFALGSDGRVTVHLGPSFTGIQTFAASFVPASGDRFHVADLDGDGHSDLFLTSASGATLMRRGGASTHHPGVWYELGPVDSSSPSVGLVNPVTGQWHLRNSTGAVTSFYFGNPSDYPFMGDWNCDGIATPGLYRQSDGFVYLRNSNTQGIANITFFFGNPGDVPIAGDFNGNGCDTVSIYRPSNQTFYIINALGQDGGNLGAATTSYVFGNPGDKPFTGDFNGNGVTTVGLHRESTGFVYYRNTHTQGNADNQFFFGNPGDRFVTGDWNANGIDSPAVFRPSNTTFYFRYTNTQGNADVQFVWGQPGWLPVSGTFGLG